MDSKPVKTPQFPPSLGLFIGIIAVSTASIFIRLSQNELPSLEIAAYRLGIAGLIMSIIALFGSKSHFRSISKKHIPRLLLSGVFLALHFATWITSLEHTSIASSVVLVTTTPIWVSILASIFLKEKLTRWTILGLFIALTGGIIIGLSEVCETTGLQITCSQISSFQSGSALFGDLLALLGAFTAAGYILITRSVREELQVIPYAATVYSVGAIILISGLAQFGKFTFPVSNTTLVYLFLLALVPQVIGHTLFNWSLGFVPATVVSIVLLGEPIGSTILGHFILHETPTNIKIIGAGLILIGIFIASKKQEVKPKRCNDQKESAQTT